MKALVALSLALLIGFADTAAADDFEVPAPGMVANATTQADGVIVVWTVLLGAEVEGYEITRSRSGSAFAAIGTAGATATTFVDADGQSNDIYVVTATLVGGASTMTSNPAPALPAFMQCPWTYPEENPPYFWVAPECIIGPGNTPPNPARAHVPTLAILR